MVRLTGSGNRRHRGFTLIELMVVLTILAMLVTMIAPRYFHRLDKAKVETQQQQLREIRKLLDEYHADTNNWPRELEALVKAGYIATLPIDPFTERNDTWIPVYVTEGNKTGVMDIKSGYRDNN